MTEDHVEVLAPLDLGDGHVLQLTRRIFHARGFAHRLRAAGWDADDALQEIYLGLLTRQIGRSRFDPRRASLSTYLWRVISSVTSHLLTRRQTRDRQREILSADVSDDLAVPCCDSSLFLSRRLYDPAALPASGRPARADACAPGVRGP